MTTNMIDFIQDPEATSNIGKGIGAGLAAGLGALGAGIGIGQIGGAELSLIHI